MVVTRLKFDTKAPTPKLFFKAMRWLSDEEFALTQEKGQSPDALKAVDMTVSQMDGVSAPEPAPFMAAGQPPKAAKPAPAPAAQDEDDEPPAPPPKAAKATKAKPAPAPAASEDEDGPAPEPTVRKAAAPAATAVPAASGLAQALADWDDE